MITAPRRTLAGTVVGGVAATVVRFGLEQPARVVATALGGPFRRFDPFWTFRAPDATSINTARMAHLDSLGLDLEGCTVLEVGAGIGLLTDHLLQLGCRVLATDARPANVVEHRRRHPDRRVEVLDLDQVSPADIAALGHFDVVFCYGLLYHLARPGPALSALAGTADLLLLETCVTPGTGTAEHQVWEDRTTASQAIGGTGCRPTRPWVMETLRQLWGHAYVTRAQPDHPDFPLEWPDRPTPPPTRLTRSVFVASRRPLDLPSLSDRLEPVQQVLGGRR